MLLISLGRSRRGLSAANAFIHGIRMTSGVLSPDFGGLWHMAGFLHIGRCKIQLASLKQCLTF